MIISCHKANLFSNSSLIKGKRERERDREREPKKTKNWRESKRKNIKLMSYQIVHELCQMENV